MMGLCFEGRDPLKDGVNEHGLMGCTNSFAQSNTYAGTVDQRKKINLSSLHYLNYALGNYRTVAELVEDLDQIYLSKRDAQGDLQICPDFHYFFADGQGNSIVLEPKNGRLEAYENPYGVMTNSPYLSSHEKRLKKLMDPDKLHAFNAAKHLPGGYDPISRFIKAYYLKETHVKPKNGSEALSYAYSILDALKMPQGFVKLKGNPDHSYTRYQCAYDNRHPLLTLKGLYSSTIYSLTFEDILFPERRLVFSHEGKLDLQKLMSEKTP